MERKCYVYYLLQIKRDMEKQNQTKDCLFHKDKEHDIEECFDLNKEIEILIAKGYIQ
jgi:hypothetical protein